MSVKINRRNWLKSGLAVGLGLGLQHAGATAILHTGLQNKDEKENTAGGDPKFVKLNANENPYGPSQMARDAIVESMTKGNLYPRPFQKQLKEAIAEKEGLSPDHVLLAAGSTEILGVCGLYFGQKGGKFVSEEPTFMSFPLHAQQSGTEWIKVPMNE